MNSRRTSPKKRRCFIYEFFIFQYYVITSARTNTNVPHMGARLPLPGSLALGAQQCKPDVNLRIFALLGTPSAQSVHYYYPFALKDGGRLVLMAVELVDRLAILAQIRRFLGMGVVNSRSLQSDSYDRIQYFARRST
jgi:hypothetical protein